MNEIIFYPAFNLIELQYAEGGTVIVDVGNIVGLVKFNSEQGYINILLREGHVVCVKADYGELTKKVWGATGIPSKAAGLSKEDIIAEGISK